MKQGGTPQEAAITDRSAGTVVRVSAATRRVIVRLFSAIIGLTVAATALSLIGIIHNPNPSGGMLAGVVVLVAGCALVIASVVRGRVVIHPDRIEVTRNLWPARTISRADIVARRFQPYVPRRSAAHHVLILGDGREVHLPPYLEHSDVLNAWMHDIPLASRQGRRA